jgi:hypothetical protein
MSEPDWKAIAAKLYHALCAMPCRCQLAGGERWHLQAMAIVATQCSRCAAIELYEIAAEIAA